MNKYAEVLEKDNRKIVLSNYVDMKTVQPIIEKIIEINYDDEINEEKYVNYTRRPIELVINSFGGSIYDGMALFDTISNSVTPVHTISSGSSMSMGFILLLAGHKRYATKYSTLMYHECSGGVHDKLEGIKLEVVEMTRLQDEILDKIVLEKTLIPKEKLLDIRKHKQEWFLSANEALKWGIIDEII